MQGLRLVSSDNVFQHVGVLLRHSQDLFSDGQAGYCIPVKLSVCPSKFNEPWTGQGEVQITRQLTNRDVWITFNSCSNSVNVDLCYLGAFSSTVFQIQNG